MRLYPVLALMTSAFALAACGGGGGAGGGFGSSVLGAGGVASGVTNSCPITGVDTTPDKNCTTTGSTTPPTTVVDTDGDGIPDKTDTDGSGGSGSGGNTTGLTTGNRTLLSKKFLFDEPTTAKTALSTVRSSATASAASTTAAILSANKPKQLIYAIDTKSASNSEIAVQVAMGEHRNGTRDLRWVTLGHNTFASSGATMVNGAPVLNDLAGNPTVEYSTTTGTYMNRVTNARVDYRDDYYWNQLSAYMDPRANGGAGANYREYRVWDRSAGGANRDELMQVWAWDDSYAIQYQNSTLADDPKHHAWSYGGNAAANMPTSGKATYNGRFVAHAKTSNFVQAEGSEVDPNGRWSVQGRSTFDTDFATGKVDGTLTPETWISLQDNKYVLWNTSASDNPSVNTADPVKNPNYRSIYENEVKIDGTIEGGGTAAGNTFAGTAKLTQGFDTGDNSALGGFYGATGNELTGVFMADGAIQSPFGGSDGIVENREGYLTITGAFNANCTNPGGVCAP
jgi:C-lobe and N-lobe beta barrels of Tf-binding protein B